MTKYNNNDNKTVLDTTDDAAYVNWGSSWRMPTSEQIEELIENTTSAWTQVEWVNGVLLTPMANTNTLFFPVVGNADSDSVGGIGETGSYWSRSLDESRPYDAWRLDFNGSGGYGMGYDYRFYGLSVRPVRFSEPLR